MTIEEIDKHLRFLRVKYKFKSYFRKAKRIVTDFIPLEEIQEPYIFFRKNVRSEIQSLVFIPKTYNIASQAIPVELKPVEVLGLSQVLIYPEATSFLSAQRNKLFFEKIADFSEDYTILYNTRNILFHSHKLVKLLNLPLKRDYSETSCVFMGGTFCFNYFHLLTEILPKFQFLNQIPEKVVIVTSIAVQKNKNLNELFLFFSSGQEVKFLDTDYYYKFEKLWHITYPNAIIPNIGEGEFYQASFAKFSKESILYVREVCLRNYDQDRVRIKPVSRVFFARKSAFRQYNEHELLIVAENYGFTPVYLEELNIHEQIYLVRNADYIVGPSGAAWTNILFSVSGKTRGLMWLGKVWNDFSIFSTLATFVDFDLYHWRFEQDNSSFHADYVLSSSDFEKHLLKLLNL